ncbi:hypothetical protein JTB14_010557 [Gonioctena quinquepunctata]|nr:hypothetical protein JTB14_010557 [Gonioctena quinquepunctata]
MDDVFSGKAWSKPVAIASSTGLSIQSQKSNSVEGLASGCSTMESSTSKETIASSLGKRLKQKKEHEHYKAKRHKEKMETDKKWLEVIQNMSSK